jgi:hypothetical protein
MMRVDGAKCGRSVCLMDTRSHEQLDAQIGAMTQGELTFTADLQFSRKLTTASERNCVRE